MAGEKAKGGKKNRKIGRSSRSNSGKAYKGVSRWLSNKEKAIKRDEKEKASCAARKKARAKAGKPQRGDARRKRRADIQR